jgi:hypothetical protein
VLSDNRTVGDDSRSVRIGCLRPEQILGLVRVRLRDFTFFNR